MLVPSRPGARYCHKEQIFWALIFVTLPSAKERRRRFTDGCLSCLTLVMPGFIFRAPCMAISLTVQVRYGRQNGSDCKLFSGTNEFAGQITSALDALRTGGDFGAKFISDLATGSDNIDILSTTGRNVTQEGIIYVNPERNDDVPTERGNRNLPV